MLRVHHAVPKQQTHQFETGEPDITEYSNTTTPTQGEPMAGVACHGNDPVTLTNQPPPKGGEFERVTAVIAWGKRPVPFRTRKLRPTAPMVLHSRGCGRVGHRRTQPPRMARATTPGPSLHHQRNSPPPQHQRGGCSRLTTHHPTPGRGPNPPPPQNHSPHAPNMQGAAVVNRPPSRLPP